MHLSIIIPAYNASGTVTECLDSIYSQQIPLRDFEVIVVDDCSTDNTGIILAGYKYKGTHPENLIILTHEVNKRQGAARNTGIDNARGEYIIFLDADDFIKENTLASLLQELAKTPGLDFLMYDYEEVFGGNVIRSGVYSSRFPTQVMTGEEFFSYPIPWVPWLYLYRTSSLRENGIRFVEHKRFEDTDFVLHFTACAAKCIFTPIVATRHTVGEASTVAIGSDTTKIRELFEQKLRISEIAGKFRNQGDLYRKIMGHAIYGRKSYIIKLIWRLKYREARDILKKTGFRDKTDDFIVNLSNSHPEIIALAGTIMRPLLNLALRIRRIGNTR